MNIHNFKFSRMDRLTQVGSGRTHTYRVYMRIYDADCNNEPCYVLKCDNGSESTQGADYVERCFKLVEVWK